ncbi:MAG: hypothetical protein PVI50_08425 [Gammaproteobacteria bacterium]|jgi:hypothetical protein
MNYADWHIPLSQGDLTLQQGLDSLTAVGARQQEIPLIVRLLENPRYHLPGVTLFHGAVDLEQHDRIHILLGRGLLTADEAFTIGFTMGSTKRVHCPEAWLFGVLARRAYPPPYRFDAAAVRIFHDAVRLGGISVCQALDRIDFPRVTDLPLREIRRQVGLEEDLLLACYRIEQTRYPQSRASRRLLE